MRPPQQNMTLVNVCECAVLWAFQIRASLLQHRFRLSFDRTGKAFLCLMAQNHVLAASLRLSCWYQKGAYRFNGVRFKPCSPYIDINSIYGFSDVSQVCQICQIKVFLTGASLDPQMLFNAEGFALCLIFFPLWFDYKQPHFQNGGCSISDFQISVGACTPPTCSM